MKPNAYPDPTLFREVARQHMRKWVRSELGVEPIDPQSVILPEALAVAVKNFFDGRTVRRSVEQRFPRTLLGTEAGRGSRAADALCSAHIPFNLFAPLQDYGVSGEAAKVVSEVIGITVDEVRTVEFEQPKSRKHSLLGDNTAFATRLTSPRKSGQVKTRIGSQR
jgi:hypothetical protein